jgi:hypothetical protein
MGLCDFFTLYYLINIYGTLKRYPADSILALFISAIFFTQEREKAEIPCGGNLEKQARKEVEFFFTNLLQIVYYNIIILL